MAFNWFRRNKNPETITPEDPSNTQEDKVEAVPVKEAVVEPGGSKPEESPKRRKKRWEKRTERKAGKAAKENRESVEESPVNLEESPTVENTPKEEELSPEKKAQMAEQAVPLIAEAAQEEIARSLELTVAQKQQLMKGEVSEEIKQSIEKKKFLGERAVDALVGIASGAGGVAAVKMLASYGLRSSLKRMIDIGAPGMGAIVGAAVGGSFELVKTWRNESKRVEEERKASLESVNEISEAHKEKLSGLKGKKRMEALMKLRQEADLSEQEKSGLNELYEKYNSLKIDKKKIGIAVLKGATIGGLGGAVGGVVAEKLFGAAGVVSAAAKESAPPGGVGSAAKESLSDWMKSHSGDIVKGKVSIPAEINGDITANVEKNVWTTVKEYLKAHGINKPSNALINEATRKITDLNNVEITSDHSTKFAMSVHHHMENGVKDVLMQKGHEIHHLESLNDLIKANGGSVDSVPAEINIQAPGNIPPAGLPPDVNMQEQARFNLGDLKKLGYIAGSLGAGYGIYRLYKKMRKPGEEPIIGLGLSSQEEESGKAEDDKAFETIKEANSLFEEAERALEDHDIPEAKEKLRQAEEKLKQANGDHLRSGQKNRLRDQKRDLGEKIKAAWASVLAGAFWGARESSPNNQQEENKNTSKVTPIDVNKNSQEQKSRVAYFMPPVEEKKDITPEVPGEDIKAQEAVTPEAEKDERQKEINNKLNRRLADWKLAVEQLEQAAEAGNREEYKKLSAAANLAKKEINIESNRLTSGLQDHSKKTKWFKSKKAEMGDLDARVEKSKETLDLAESKAKAAEEAVSLEQANSAEVTKEARLDQELSPHARILTDKLKQVEVLLTESQNNLNGESVDSAERAYMSAQELFNEVNLGDVKNFKNRQEQYKLIDKKHDLRTLFHNLRDAIDRKKDLTLNVEDVAEQSGEQSDDLLDKEENFEDKYEKLALDLNSRVKTADKLISQAEEDFNNGKYDISQNNLTRGETVLTKANNEILSERDVKIRDRLKQELQIAIIKAAKKGQNLKTKLENLKSSEKNKDAFNEIDKEYSRAAGTNMGWRKMIQRFNKLNDLISELEENKDPKIKEKILQKFPKISDITDKHDLPEQFQYLYDSHKQDAIDRLKEMGESELAQQIENPSDQKEEKEAITTQTEAADKKTKNEGRDLRLNEDKWFEIVGKDGLLEKVVGQENFEEKKKELVNAIKQFNKNHPEPLVPIYERFLAESFNSDTAGRLVDELSTLSEKMINVENTARSNLHMPRRKIKAHKKNK